MDNTFTISAIQETPTYKALASKKEQVKINILEQRIVRQRITHAFKVWQNTGKIPTTVKFIELDVVNDLINAKQTDRSFGMSAENLGQYE